MPKIRDRTQACRLTQQHETLCGVAESESMTLIKWLKIVGNVLCELSSLDVMGSRPFPADDRVRTAGQAFQRSILASVPALAQSLAPDVRRHLASCVSDPSLLLAVSRLTLFPL